MNAGTLEIPSDVVGAYSVPIKTMKRSIEERLFKSTVRQRYDFSCGSAALASRFGWVEIALRSMPRLFALRSCRAHLHYGLSHAVDDAARQLMSTSGG